MIGLLAQWGACNFGTAAAVATTDPAKKAIYNRRSYLRSKKRKQLSTGEVEKKVLWQGRLPETLVARIQRVTIEGVATGKYPWRTQTECATDLLRRGFASLKGDPFIDEMLPHLEMAQHLDRVSQLRREAQSTLNKARTEISELLNIGSNDGAATYYHVTMEAARKMPPTEWRDWLIKELKSSYPDLARIKPKGVALKSIAKAKKKAKGIHRLVRA